MAIKICPGCNAINEEYATACKACRELLIQVPATDPVAPPVGMAGGHGAVRDGSSATGPEALMYLEGPSGSGFLARVDGLAVIGRGAEIDVSAVDPDEYISRTHLKLFHRNGKWWAEHLSEMNPTLLAGAKLTRGRPVILEDGDRLTLAKTEFLVRFHR